MIAPVRPWCFMISGYYPLQIYAASIDPYLQWPTFTFISAINHLAVHSQGLSVEECRGFDHNGINSLSVP